MKKETAIIGFIAVAVVAFFLGTLTVKQSGKGEAEKKEAKTEEAGKPALAAAAGLDSHAWKGAKEAKVVIVEASDFQ